ncbi:uncharacterized protein MYCFIDRAFT_143425 [Pseudocercospora fijiensis CIRAD86]|uniref:DUF202 domain-containing protein n=1 Tax=Pseudocercospora fijiensis (strain CIRAD86) TaxID=383855 RepID=M2YNF0_PSEFD|nr:uncharacterized protein MYCFIDRAFT_143425 [Pseudocercospora fijiensis CIRAD86]EME79230.1 hypothetical protein MYCFIDRAFT_143425 [Pseudocercospora fijiensis CIRAD86]
MESDSTAKGDRTAYDTDGALVEHTRGDLIPEPEPAYIPDGIPDDEREAQELHQVASEPRERISRILSPGTTAQESWFGPVKNFWRHHVRIDVPHVDCRDHLANERTFLGYLRTSVALSMLGTMIAQLYRLQHSPKPNPVFGYFVLGKPISAILQCMALCMLLLGAIRYFRQQAAMARGRVYAGGWEMWVIVGGMSLVSRDFYLRLLGGRGGEVDVRGGVVVVV